MMVKWTGLNLFPEEKWMHPWNCFLVLIAKKDI